MASLRNTCRLMANARQFSRTAVKNVDTIPDGYKKLKFIQAQFQKPDGLPVHLKGGAVDKILLGITTALCVIGVGISVHLIYQLSVPQKAN